MNTTNYGYDAPRGAHKPKAKIGDKVQLFRWLSAEDIRHRQSDKVGPSLRIPRGEDVSKLSARTYGISSNHVKLGADGEVVAVHTDGAATDYSVRFAGTSNIWFVPDEMVLLLGGPDQLGACDI